MPCKYDGLMKGLFFFSFFQKEKFYTDEQISLWGGNEGWMSNKELVEKKTLNLLLKKNDLIVKLFQPKKIIKNRGWYLAFEALMPVKARSGPCFDEALMVDVNERN